MTRLGRNEASHPDEVNGLANDNGAGAAPTHDSGPSFVGYCAALRQLPSRRDGGGPSCRLGPGRPCAYGAERAGSADASSRTVVAVLYAAPHEHPALRARRFTRRWATGAGGLRRHSFLQFVLNGVQSLELIFRHLNRDGYKIIFKELPGPMFRASSGYLDAGSAHFGWNAGK